jgi:transposase-like protein
MEGVMARGQRSRSKEHFWRQAVGQWRRSDLSVRAFCAERDLSEPAFYSWRRTLARRDQEAGKGRVVSRPARDGQGENGNEPPAFLPIQVVPASGSPATGIDIVLRAGAVVRVTAGFDAATLRQVLAVLEGPTC